MDVCTRDHEVAHARRRPSDYDRKLKPFWGTPECKFGGCRERAHAWSNKKCMEFYTHEHQITHALRSDYEYLVGKKKKPFITGPVGGGLCGLPGF